MLLPWRSWPLLLARITVWLLLLLQGLLLLLLLLLLFPMVEFVGRMEVRGRCPALLLPHLELVTALGPAAAALLERHLYRCNKHQRTLREPEL
jgi:hypothetical protein